jgi:hypothetical protein
MWQWEEVFTWKKKKNSSHAAKNFNRKVECHAYCSHLQKKKKKKENKRITGLGAV